jgi:hypothetical protein
MLVIAGLIEGFLSPTNLPVWLKFLLAASLFTLLVVYLMRAAGATYLPEEADPFDPTPPVKSGPGPLLSNTG